MIYNYLWIYLFGSFFCLIDNIFAREAIVGGDKAEIDQFRYQVSLNVEGKSICGGGIIGDEYILTAAHCVIGEHNTFHTGQITVVAATIDPFKITKPAVLEKVKTVFVPKEYNRTDVDTTGDIAVLKLNGPLGVHKKHLFLSHKHLKELRLPKEDESFTDKSAIIAGFGCDYITIRNNKEYSGHSDFHLRFAEADVIDTSHCQHGYLQPNVFDRYICARVKQRGPTLPRGVCDGDSGSPLVHEEIVIGILSSSPKGCSEHIEAGIYTRVAHYLSFINNSMKNHLDDIRVHDLIR